MFVPASTIRRRYEISRSCLANWADKDLVRHRRIDGGKRLYHLRDVESRLIGPSDTRNGRSVDDFGDDANKKKNVIYARVSSSKQKEDLRRQVDELRREYPGFQVYQDIGSGLNYRRRKFEALLDGVYRDTIGTIAVSHRDRLCRYGFDLVESFCRFHDVLTSVNLRK